MRGVVNAWEASLVLMVVFTVFLVRVAPCCATTRSQEVQIWWGRISAAVLANGRAACLGRMVAFTRYLAWEVFSSSLVFCDTTRGRRLVRRWDRTRARWTKNGVAQRLPPTDACMASRATRAVSCALTPGRRKLSSWATTWALTRINGRARCWLATATCMASPRQLGRSCLSTPGRGKLSSWRRIWEAAWRNGPAVSSRRTAASTASRSARIGCCSSTQRCRRPRWWAMTWDQLPKNGAAG
mmetsp:Transcript_47186/g.143425  ORF Transcript_47186/g.143425 Transcript_47186/m.143425 type:complete len:241 (+) Transcript_47186:1054-1776(+)